MFFSTSNQETLEKRIKMENINKKKNKRVVLVPYLLQSHTRAMLDLGSILHSKGFSITIAHPKVSFPSLSDQPPEFNFIKLEDDSVGLDTSLGNQLELIKAVNESCAEPFEDLLTHMLEGDKEELLACVVYDPIMKFAEVAAKKVRVPTVVLWTVSAVYVNSCLVLNRLIEQKVFPVSESQVHDEIIPDEYPLRLCDVAPFPAKEIPQINVDFLRSYMDLESASAMIWNTIEFLDRPLLEKIQKQHWKMPFFPIMPSSTPRKTTSASGAYLSWLDKQSPKSVIYVALGTIALLDEKSLLDLAWGLAKSQQPFLWSLRRSSLQNGGNAIEKLPSNFMEAIEDRGLIVEWVDQRRVLAHGSVGGFLTHCGWNSIMESLSEGIPLLCRACFGDQPINARYITTVWKLGIELAGNCSVGEIERSVRALMVGEECEGIRRRVFEAKEKIEELTREGGPWYDSVDRLVDFIGAASSGNVS